MKHLGIEIPVKNMPALDPEFIPIDLFNRAFLKDARTPIAVAVERENGQVAVARTFIHGTSEMAAADSYYIDRLVKSILWMKGGFKVVICGDRGIYKQLKAAYCPTGSRAFDAQFMSSVYERPFEVVYTDSVPEETGSSQSVGRRAGISKHRHLPRSYSCLLLPAVSVPARAALRPGHVR